MGFDEYSELEALRRGATAGESPTKQGAKIKRGAKLIEVYRSNYGILKQLSMSLSKADGSSVKEFMVAVLKLKGGVEKAQAQELKSLYKVVERLSVYDSKLFKEEQNGSNGAGIFVYLKGGLKAVKAREMVRVFESAKELLDGRKAIQYKAFLDTAKLLLGVADVLPSEEGISNDSLIEAIQGVNGAELVQISESATAASANVEMEEVDEKDPFFISDYGAALIVLAARFQADLYEEVEGVLREGTLKGGGSVNATRKKRKRSSSSVRSTRSSSRLATPPKKYTHNPLITIYFFLREMANRLTYEQDPIAIHTYILFSKQLYNYLIRLEQTIEMISALDRNKVYSRAYGFEAYILEAYEHPTLFSGNEKVLRDLCHTIRTAYYGVRSVLSLDSQKRDLSERAIPLLIGKALKHVDISLNPMIFVKENIKHMKKVGGLIGRFDALYMGMETPTGESESVRTPSPKEAHASPGASRKPHSKTHKKMKAATQKAATQKAAKSKRSPKPYATPRWVNTEMKLP
jgi:hypothetical protein